MDKRLVLAGLSFCFLISRIGCPSIVGATQEYVQQKLNLEKHIATIDGYKVFKAGSRYRLVDASTEQSAVKVILEKDFDSKLAQAKIRSEGSAGLVPVGYVYVEESLRKGATSESGALWLWQLADGKCLLFYDTASGEVKLGFVGGPLVQTRGEKGFYRAADFATSRFAVPGLAAAMHVLQLPEVVLEIKKAATA